MKFKEKMGVAGQTGLIAIALLVALVGCHSRRDRTSPNVDDSKQNRIIVPGGLKQDKLVKLWKVAKNKCFELGYVVSNEDKETGNVFCTKGTDSGPRTLLINFDKEGFLVSTKTPLGENRDVLSGFLNKFDKSTKQHKIEMENALKQAAGV